jgi:hypothetical protein
MTTRRITYAIWYEVLGQYQAHAVILEDQPYQRFAPAPHLKALCGAEVPEGSPWQYDSDFHDCAACKAALALKAG